MGRAPAGRSGPTRSSCTAPTSFAVTKPAIVRDIAQHPIDLRFAATHDVPAVTFEELMPSPRWQLTGLYNEFFRPLRLENLLCTAFESEAMPFVALAIARSGSGFTAREHFLLDLLRPHVASAYDLVQKLMRCRVLPPIDESQQDLLTPRETEVLHWVTQGKTNTQIAIIRGAARLTVKKHVERILRKLNVETRTAAAIRGIELGLSNPGDQRTRQDSNLRPSD